MEEKINDGEGCICIIYIIYSDLCICVTLYIMFQVKGFTRFLMQFKMFLSFIAPI